MTTVVRPPAVAGMFYPESPGTLRKTITGYLNLANPPELTELPTPAAVRAIIVPHAGYVYSGAVAAFAYKLLAAQATPPTRFYLMGPAHRVWFSGVALADYEAFDTPLGRQPLDTEKIEVLAASGAPFAKLNAPHKPEHSLEVQIPFLRVIAPEVPVVPMLFGEVDPTVVGRALDGVLEPGDVIIVSSDLSHFHDNRTAHTRDRQFLDALLRGDRHGVGSGEACGQVPALALMTIAERRGWQPHLLDYRTSGDITGEEWRVVGYASVAYVEEA